MSTWLASRPILPADLVAPPPAAILPAHRAPSRLERAPSTVRLSPINGFDLRIDGVAVPLPQSAQRLLTFLAIQGRPVTRLYVASNLWLDKSQDRAGANLRSVLLGHALVRAAAGAGDAVPRGVGR